MHSETQIEMKIHILAFANGKYRVFCLEIPKVNLQHFLVYFQPPYVPKARMRLKTEFFWNTYCKLHFLVFLTLQTDKL